MRALALILALTGCAAQTALPPIAIPLRNPTTPVASQADATLERLRGGWVVVEGAGIAPGARLQFDGGQVGVDGTGLPVVDRGLGRLGLGDETIWVHWLDADNRTAALGEPGGARVWIMDRTGRPGERLAAARDILTWYGYDITRLDRP